MKNYKIVIWGWGVTGQAALNYFLNSINFKKFNLDIDIYDGNKKENFDEDLIKKQPKNVNFYFETNHIQDLSNIDLILVSPSVSENHPDIISARSLKIPIYNDVSYFIYKWRKNNKKIIGVTGSNGKSTVVSLIHGALLSMGQKSILVGNIGKSPLDYLLQYEKNEIEIDLPVIELSSYQLETFSQNEFVDIAVITNISPNHLDHHDNSMEKYVDAKLKILGPNTQLITVLDDPGIVKYVLPKVKKPILVTLDNITPELEEFVDENKRNLKGQHNLYNIGVTLEILKILKLIGKDSLNFIRNYNGLEHRIEFVREIDGVKYINDSKSTSPDAVRVALEAHGNLKNIILIIGGSDKKVSFEMLLDPFNQYVKLIIIFDHDINNKIMKMAKKLKIPYEICPDLPSCIQSAKNASKSGEMILFSPGAASQPKFKNFEDRGEQFKKIVQNLK